LEVICSSNHLCGLSSGGGISPTLGFHMNEIPLVPPANALNGKVVIDPDLYDLTRLEVLRGPQGTLYGSGSMGGTTKSITDAPELQKFDASADFGVSGAKAEQTTKQCDAQFAVGGRCRRISPRHVG
jgi:iron complex outermembrane recepter protein